VNIYRRPIDEKATKQLSASAEKKVLDLARKGGILRPRDLQTKGLPKDYLWRLRRQEKLEKVGRGMYAMPGTVLSEHQTVVQAALRVPHGVVCLLSALRFHDLTTQSPFEIWMAIDVKARAPKEEIIPLRIVRFSGKALTAGVETHSIEGVTVRVYNPAKTVADCFKYRNKIGLDVAIEALRDCWRKKLATSDQIWHYAKVCRVSRVIRPYLESLV
jgi:predicted transcriptional regulator of viral defense system